MEGSAVGFQYEAITSTNKELQSEINRTQSLLDHARKEEEAAKSRSRRLEASMIRRKQVYERYA